jgi:hypothetical protein
MSAFAAKNKGRGKVKVNGQSSECIIKQIEEKRDATCFKKVKNSLAFCLTLRCQYAVRYNCVKNDSTGKFKVSIFRDTVRANADNPGHQYNNQNTYDKIVSVKFKPFSERIDNFQICPENAQ